MTVVFLHPEELIDRARGRGRRDERVEQHVARCVACRFARAVESDFARELGELDSRAPHERTRRGPGGAET